MVLPFSVSTGLLWPALQPGQSPRDCRGQARASERAKAPTPEPPSLLLPLLPCTGSHWFSVSLGGAGSQVLRRPHSLPWEAELQLKPCLGLGNGPPQLPSFPSLTSTLHFTRPSPSPHRLLLPTLLFPLPGIFSCSPTEQLSNLCPPQIPAARTPCPPRLYPPSWASLPYQCGSIQGAGLGCRREPT